MLAPRKKLWSTPKEVILASIMLLKPSGCDVVYDIGAGEGNFIIECAKQFNVKCIGVEIDEERCKLAESLILANGISNDICSIICENALSLDYAQGTCFFLYLIPRGLKLILPMLMNIQHRIRIVTYMSPLPNLTPIEVFKVSAIHSEAQWPLYYYELGN
jgi:ubiquinone/menaquinone biosynthesis C-methylase UbiE